MNKRFVITALFCVALAGCTASSEPGSTPTTAESLQVEQPATTSSPASTPATLTPAATVSDQFLISSRGIGAVSIGADMTKLAVEQGFELQTTCAAQFFTLDEEYAFMLPDSASDDGVVGSVYIYTSGGDEPPSAFATAEGMGLGSTLANLEVAYPEGVLNETAVGLDVSRSFLVVIDGVPIVFQFAHGDDTVTGIGVNTDHMDFEQCG